MGMKGEPSDIVNCNAACAQPMPQPLPPMVIESPVVLHGQSHLIAMSSLLQVMNPQMPCSQPPCSPPRPAQFYPTPCQKAGGCSTPLYPFSVNPYAHTPNYVSWPSYPSQPAYSAQPSYPSLPSYHSLPSYASLPSYSPQTISSLPPLSSLPANIPVYDPSTSSSSSASAGAAVVSGATTDPPGERNAADILEILDDSSESA